MNQFTEKLVSIQLISLASRESGGSYIQLEWEEPFPFN